MPAGTFAAPVGIFRAGLTDMSLAFIGAAVLILLLFVFLPKLIQYGLKATISLKPGSGSDDRAGTGFRDAVPQNTA